MGPHGPVGCRVLGNEGIIAAFIFPSEGCDKAVMGGGTKGIVISGNIFEPHIPSYEVPERESIVDKFGKIRQDPLQCSLPPRKKE